MRFINSASAVLAAFAATAMAAPTNPEAASATVTASAAATTTATTSGGERHQGLPPLPAGLTPGIHRYTHDAFGRPNITRVSELDTTSHDGKRDLVSEGSPSLEKRVNTWTGCENYGFTSKETADIANAWNGLYNWVNTGDGGYSPWISGHYFAWTDSGVFAYICEWGNGNHATGTEVNTAHAVVSSVCSGPGMYQWNEVGFNAVVTIFRRLIVADLIAVEEGSRHRRS